MTYSNAFGFTLVLFMAAISTAWAHSIKELERQLGDREQYFQPIDKDTPRFALQDADGRPVRLADFRDKVVVFHFIYTNCPDVCPQMAIPRIIEPITLGVYSVVSPSNCVIAVVLTIRSGHREDPTTKK